MNNGKFLATVTVAVRCVDIGGWLDTWFSKYGEILNLGVYSRYFGRLKSPFRGIKVTVFHEKSDKTFFSICADDPNYDIVVTLDELRSSPNHSNLLTANLYLLQKDYEFRGHYKIDISSSIEPGASLGTSAAVSVGTLLAMCEAINVKKPVSEIAKMAWRAETEVMGGQSGTQDQFAAAFSNACNFLEITSYPKTKYRKVTIPKKVKKALENGLITIFYGKHDSSAMHSKVISKLEKQGSHSPKLKPFRGLAKNAEKCLKSGDLIGYGKIMQQNTKAQQKLYEGLVCQKATLIINLSRKFSALGFKINGAGGAGGSITLLFPKRENAEMFYNDCIKKFPLDDGYVYYEHELASN